MRVYLSFLFLLSFFSVSGQSTHVLFGEREVKHDAFALYLDKDGFLYPDCFISNTSLDSCKASLLNWYAKHPSAFLTIAKQYGCQFETFTGENVNVLNDSILAFTKRLIGSKKADCGSVSFLIHGYRKPFLKSNNDRTSPRDYEILEEKVGKSLKTIFVEVYWDAMYDCCFSTNRKNNNALFDLLKEAEKNSLPVGHTLRKVIYNLQFDTINIITHSLGAKVALHALFDFTESTSPTPVNNRINICLIAPALSVDEVLKNYYNRKTDFDFKNKDNYRLMIGYNEHDFVLRKKVGWFGPGPYKHLNTTLGCNHKGCVKDLKENFEKKLVHSPLLLFDLASVGQCHLVGCYCSSNHLDALLESLKK